MYYEHWGFRVLSAFWFLTCWERWARKAPSAGHCRIILWLPDHQVIFHRGTFNNPLSEVSREVFKWPTWSLLWFVQCRKNDNKNLTYEIVNQKLPVTKWKLGDCNSHERREDSTSFGELQKLFCFACLLFGFFCFHLFFIMICIHDLWKNSCSASAFMVDFLFSPFHWSQFHTEVVQGRVMSLIFTSLLKCILGWQKSNSWQQQKVVLLGHKLYILL